MEMNGNDEWNQVIEIRFNTVYLLYILIIFIKCSFDVQHAELYKLDEHAFFDRW